MLSQNLNTLLQAKHNKHLIFNKGNTQNNARPFFEIASQIMIQTEGTQDYLIHEINSAVQQNSHLMKRLEHFHHSLDIIEEKNRLKIEEIVTYQDAAINRTSKIRQAHTLIQRLEQDQKKLQQQVSLKGAELKERTQVLSIEQSQLREQKTVVQQLERTTQELQQECVHGEQQIQNKYSKHAAFQKLEENYRRLSAKVDQLNLQIQGQKNKQCQTSRTAEQGSRKISTLIKVINSHSARNNALRQKLRETIAENRSMPIEKVNALTKDQKQQINRLDLSVGKLNQQLVYANQRIKDLEGNIAGKKISIKEMMTQVAAYRSGRVQLSADRDNSQEQAKKQYPRTLTYLPLSSQIKIPNSIHSRSIQYKTQQKYKPHLQYRIIQSEEQIDQQLSSKGQNNFPPSSQQIENPKKKSTKPMQSITLRGFTGSLQPSQLQHESQKTMREKKPNWTQNKQLKNLIQRYEEIRENSRVVF